MTRLMVLTEVTVLVQHMAIAVIYQTQNHGFESDDNQSTAHGHHSCILLSEPWF